MSGTSKLAWVIAGVLALAGCTENPNFDFRDMGGGFGTSSGGGQAIAARPEADPRGIISYPGYQIVVARRGDTVADVAARIGLDAGELARHNGLTPGVSLREDEVLALPQRVAEPADTADFAALAGAAIDRAGPSAPGRAPSADAAAGIEPIRHQVARGETAFTIARLYNVSVRSLADWNGLGTDLVVREGQFLVIPIVIDPPDDGIAAVAAPGIGTATPTPPSAATPLPDPEIAAAAPEPAAPEVVEDAGGKLVMPVSGSVIREYIAGKTDGIDIAASPGATVVAAEAGEVAAITRNTDQVPIIVIRHADNLLTVYAGVDGLVVQKGDKVARGQKIAVIRDTDPSFLHFEVRRGLDSVDPMEFLG